MRGGWGCRGWVVEGLGWGLVVWGEGGGGLEVDNISRVIYYKIF